MTRIPETYNSKCLLNGKSRGESKVKTLQKWNGRRINAEPLIHDFRTWLIQQELNLKSETKKQKPQMKKARLNVSNPGLRSISQGSRISWIETLVKTPIEDHRKYCLWRILGPYLLNIKQLSEQTSADILERWLLECNKKRKLDFDIKTRVQGIVKYNKGFQPISYSKLATENNDLFILVKSKDIST